MTKINIFNFKEKDPYSYNLLKASWLQKSIRRSKLSDALGLAKLYIEEGQIKALTRKLFIIAAEDVGLGAKDSFLYLEKIKDPYIKISFLCAQNKSRESDRFLYVARNEPERKSEELVLLRNFLNISQEYITKKNKTNRENLKNLFLEYESIVGTAEIFFKEYVNLIKTKTHGASTLLAFYVLLFFRTGAKSTVKFKTIKVKDIIIPKYIPDYAIDKHTSLGKQWGRDFSHWIAEGAKVHPIYIDKDEMVEDKFLYDY